MNKCAALQRRALSILGILSLVLASTTISSPLILAQEATPSSEPAKLRSTMDDLPPLPLSPTEKAEKDGTALRLSLKDITKLALQYNLDIAIADTNEEMNRQKLIQQFGNYDPQFSAQIGVNSRKQANTTQSDFSTAAYNKTDAAQWNFTFTQPVKTGGNFQANWNSGRNEYNSNDAIFNPNFSSSLTVQFTQPLLRNLKLDSNRANIKISNLDIKLNDSKFVQRVTDTISNIQSNYWDLVSAIRSYEINRSSMRLAQINLRDNRKRVEVGTLAPIEVTDAEANAKSREVDVIAAEETILRAENTLRNLIANDKNADIWNKVIIPTEVPDLKEYPINMEEAIATALKNRPELEQADISLQQLDIQKKLNENNRKWQVDLTGAFGSSGTAGPQGCQKTPITGECILYDENGIVSPTGSPRYLTPPALVGGLGTSYKTLFTEGFTNWQVAFQVKIPLRNRTLDAQIAQQTITKQQQLMQLRQTQQSIQMEVRNAVQSLETTRRQVDSASMSRKLAQERLTAEEKRNNAGLSETYLVLSRQDALSTAAGTELRALINYKKAVITLQKAMYTLLESNDFEIAKTSSETIATAK
jgi:outer membrane protein